MALAAVGCGLLAVCVLFAASPPADSRHADGAGPLGSEGAPVGTGSKMDSRGGQYNEWTYGVRLCRMSDDAPPVLEDLSPTEVVGDGFRVVGASVREFAVDWSSHAPIITVTGYPPPPQDVPDQLHALEGFAVTSPCPVPGSDGEVPENYTELLVGLARVGNGGGGWRGLEIAYTAAGRHRVLVIQHDLLVCGLAVECVNWSPAPAGT